MRKEWTLFLTFLKIGAFTFGGGYGMVSLVRETVISNGWLTESEFLNFIAVRNRHPVRLLRILNPFWSLPFCG